MRVHHVEKTFIFVRGAFLGNSRSGLSGFMMRMMHHEYFAV